MDLFVCVGSSCHLKGSQAIIEELKKLISDADMSYDIILKGSFCMENCSKKGISVKFNDEIYTLEKDDVKMFFEKKVLPFKK